MMPELKAIPEPDRADWIADRLFTIASAFPVPLKSEYPDDFGMTREELQEFAVNHPWFKLVRGRAGKGLYIAVRKAGDVDRK